jgi:hypothetical protein
LKDCEMTHNSFENIELVKKQVRKQEWMLVPCEVCDQVTTHIITEYTFKDMIMAPGSRYWFTKEVEVDEANC